MSFNQSPGISRPRSALAAIALAAILLTVAITASAAVGSSGGIGAGDAAGGKGKGGGGSAVSDATGSKDPSRSKYKRIWHRVAPVQKRWARSTSRCESGGDPDAIGSGGRYRGAFQFTRGTWKTSPRTPGGDPVDYDYRTQAVVAVALKLRDGARHWPVCG